VIKSSIVTQLTLLLLELWTGSDRLWLILNDILLFIEGRILGSAKSRITNASWYSLHSNWNIIKQSQITVLH